MGPSQPTFGPGMAGLMAGGFVGVDLCLASGRLLGSCALSVHCGPGNTGQDTIGFEIEIEMVITRCPWNLARP